MKLSDLIERLTEIAEAYGDEAEVKIAYQPNYPLMSELRGVTCDAEWFVPNDDGQADEPGTVYLAASQGNDYAPAAVYENC